MYANNLGEFIVNRSSDNWPKEIRYIERRPVTGRFVLNPWETEKQRILWREEENAWKHIKPLQVEYAKKEKRMKYLIAMWNRHLQEVESVAGKKTGMGPMGTYGGMALAVIPGFGWASAAFSVISMGLEMLGGNKKKKRIAQLMAEMQAFENEMRKIQARLQQIIAELDGWLSVSEQVKAGQTAHAAQVAVKQGFLQAQKEQSEQKASELRKAEIARYRQLNINRLSLQPTSDVL